MKICHVTSSHKRYDGRIFEKEVKSLSEKYDVTLLCADNMESEVKDNIKIKSICSRKNTKIYRFIFNPIKLRKECLKENADIYHFHDPELLFLAKKMKKHRKKVIFDSHEDNVNRIDNRSWIPKVLKPIIKKLYELLEKSVLKKVDSVITVTDYVYERLIKINKNTHIVTNYPIIHEKEERNLNNRVLCFAGGIHKQYMHHNIIKAIDKLDVRYKIAGKVCNNYLEELKKSKSFNKVEFLGFLNRRELKDFYLNSGIGLAIIDYTPNLNFKYGSMGVTKIFEYMEVGLPVIATDFEVWDFVEKEKCGILVNPNSVDEIEKAIIYLIEHPKEAYQMGQKGRRLVEEKFNWDTQKKVLFKIYEKLEEV